MNTATLLCREVHAASDCRELGNGDASINTHCLYPSNGMVQIIVRSVTGGFLVSDEGGAIREANTAGVELTKSAQARYAAVANKQGLHFYNGVVSAPSVPSEALALAVMLVANASKEIADQIFLHHKVKRVRDFRALVNSLLRIDLKQAPQESMIAGHSTRTYRFENVIALASGGRVLIDPVLRDANSINARVIANLDVHAASNDSLTQRIVYDDEAGWESDELNVLQMTNVPVVPFSKAKTAFSNLLAA